MNATKNIVHPEWETIDPTPDIHTLFGAFDSKFFQNKLKCVVLEWSKKMYSCAGICYQRRNAMGMAITIRLSQPLLTLRPRRDLIETMLVRNIFETFSDTNCEMGRQPKTFIRYFLKFIMKNSTK